jgi:hypothetical protein
MAIMQSLKNAIEDIVVVEVIAQLSHLPELCKIKLTSAKYQPMP